MTDKSKTASRVHAGNDAASNTLRRSIKLRRNDPCPCGSGKKVKHCCGVHLEYNYDRFRPKVVEERLLLEKPDWIFRVGETVVTNDRYPEAAKRNRAATIVGRGYADNIATCYFKIAFHDSEIKHKPSIWVADYCLDKVGKGGAQ